MAQPEIAALQRALSHATEYLERLDDSPVAPTIDLAELRRRLSRPLADAGLPATDVIDALAADVRGGLNNSASARFFAWVIGGSTPAALAADWLTATWDQNAAIYSCSPAAAVVEEVVGVWTKQLLGLPATASFALTTGCQMAHVTALLAARHSLLAARGWDVEERGLSGAPAIRVLTSTEAHGTIERALRMIGVGKGAIVSLPVGADGRLQPATLAEALAAKKDVPTIVVLLAGDLNLGAFDDFGALIPLAHQHGAWVHLDGAFGLWAAASPKRRALLDGAAAADSWATDAHKWLNVPYDSGLAFVARPKDHHDAMSHRASYMTDGGGAREEVDWNPEWSRRARGFPIYAAIRELGRDGVAALVDRCCDHARALVDGMGRLPGVEVLCRPTLNQGLVRFVDRTAGATEADHARRTEEVIARLLRDGTAYFGPVTWQGRRAMRISVCNWRTSAKDVERTVAAVARCLAG